MANVTINSLPVASTIDGVNDYLPIYTNTGAATQGINRNTLLNLASGPVGLTDSQTLTNKTLTSPTINGATFSGTLSGTYTIGGTPTFPATVVQTTTSQTLTNKTLTSPTINSPTITNATLSSDAISGYTSSTTGSIFGINVNSGVFSSSNIIVNSNITTGNLYTTKIYNPYKFRAWGNTLQSVDSTLSTVMIFNNIDYDTGSNFNTSTYTFTAPVAGWYHFDYRIGHWTNTTYQTEVVLFVNGANATRGNLATGTLSNQGSDTLKLNANDQVKAIGYSSTTQNNNAGSEKSVQYFSGFLMSTT